MATHGKKKHPWQNIDTRNTFRKIQKCWSGNSQWEHNSSITVLDYSPRKNGMCGANVWLQGTLHMHEVYVMSGQVWVSMMKWVRKDDFFGIEKLKFMVVEYITVELNYLLYSYKLHYILYSYCKILYLLQIVGEQRNPDRNPDKIPLRISCTTNHFERLDSLPLNAI